MPVSVYPRRSINLKRFLLLVVTVAVLGGASYALHKMQVKKNADAMLRTAQNFRGRDKLDDALTHYEKYLNFRPKDVNALLEYIEVLGDAAKTDSKRKRELYETYEKLMGADPKRSDDRRKLIAIYIDGRVYSRANRHLEELMKLDNAFASDPEVLGQYGLCAQKLGMRDAAISRYRSAIETGKAPSDTYLRLANILQTPGAGTGSLEEARKLLDRLIVDRPKDPAARLARARYFLALKQNADAIRELQTALSTNPDAAKSPEIVIILADLHRQNRDLSAARDVLVLAVAASPAEIRFRLILADLLAALHDKAAGDKQLQEALRLAPMDDPVAVDVLDRMIERGDAQDLLHIEQELKKRYAEKPGAYADYLFGKHALANGNWPDAHVKLARSLGSFEKQPRLLAKTHEALGRCAKAANNPERMAACFQSALNADPLLESARLGLAEANVRLGRGGEAAATFRNFAETNADARAMLAKLAFEEQARKPADRRDWHAFEEALGPPPYPAQLENLRLASLRLRDRRVEAIAVAKSLVEKQPENVNGYLALAALQGETDAKAALETLAAAEAKIGDKVEIRLAKANVLANAPDAKAEALIALTEDSTMFPVEDRYTLYWGVANTLVRKLRKPAEAVPLFKQAASAKPTDLASRSALVELYFSLKQYADADAVIEEIRVLDDTEGPTYLFALVSRGALSLQANDQAKLADLRAKIALVLKARPTWGRAALLAAELDDAAQDREGALEKFRLAFRLGERRPAGVQRLVALLVGQRRFEEARAVLAETESSIGLSDDLRRQGSLLEATAEKPEAKAEDLVKATADSKLAADHLFRAQWFLLANRAPEAVLAFEKAISLDGTLADGWLGLVLATASTGNTVAANAAWERAKTALTALTLPDAALLPQWLGLGREALGDSAGAERLYKDGLAKFPNHPALLVQLAVLYQKLGRNDEAAVPFQALLNSGASDTVKRFARRELAFGLIAKNGLRELKTAIDLVSANDPPMPDDLRMKGILISLDPFRRAEARRLIEQAAMLAAPSQYDAPRLADFYVRDNELGKAEEVLKDASRGSTTVPLGQFIILHYLQRKLGKDAEANATLERIVKLAPGTWEATVEQARAMVAHGEKAEAAKKLLAHAAASDPGKRLNLAVPALVDLGCIAEAEDALKASLESKLADRYPRYIFFLANQSRGLEALRMALAMPDADYGPVKARILAAMVLPLPRAATPDKTEWDKLIDDVSKWTTDGHAKNANDVNLLTLAGVIADARGQYEAATASFSKALASEPKAETAANCLAFLLVVGPVADPARAEAMMTKLIGEVGPKPALLDTRAAARLAQGRTAEASSDIEAAIAQLPSKAVYLYRLAQVREKAGDLPARTLALSRAMRLGLKKETLHPLEWSAFEKMTMAR